MWPTASGRHLWYISIHARQNFQGISQLFGIFYHYIYETFGHQDRSQSSKPLPDHQSCKNLELNKKFSWTNFLTITAYIYMSTFLIALINGCAVFSSA